MSNFLIASLNVIMLSVVMLNVVAPVFTPQQTKLSSENFWELKIEINNPGLVPNVVKLFASVIYECS